MHTTRRHITVRVGAGRRMAGGTSRPRVVFVGVAPPEQPWVSDRHPDLRVRQTRGERGDEGVEHLRVPAGADLSAFPGMDASRPSHLRDALGLALGAGAPAVDVLLARHPGSAPWDLWRDGVLGLVEQFLPEVQSTIVVMPDAVGPPETDLRRAPPEARLANVHVTAARYAELFSANFQIGLMDLPLAAEPLQVDTLKRIASVDAALCAWEGAQDAMLRHGWRSAAALTAVALTTAPLPSSPIEGARMALRGGRTIVRPRWQALGVPERAVVLPSSVAEHCVRVQLAPSGDQAQFASQASLRSPLGAWPLPLLRTAKLIHHRLVIAANMFVFRDATPTEALGLQTALRMALDDFVRVDLVSGPSGHDEPQVVTRASPNPATPALMAHVACFLRPWVREMRVNVSVRPGQQPQLEVA